MIKRVLKRFVPRRDLDLRWKLPSGLTVRIASHADWVIYNDIYVDGEYDVPILECLGAHDRGSVLNVLDIGANVGYFGLRLIDLLRKEGTGDWPYRLTMIEGSPDVARELRKRIDLAGEFGSRVVVVAGLVGKKEGSARIVQGDFHPMNSIMGGGDGGEEVAFVDLDRLDLGPIDLLKCDIEGAELQFLETYPDLLTRVRSAVFELHPKLCDTGRCLELLGRAGLVNSAVLRDAGHFQVMRFGGDREKWERGGGKGTLLEGKGDIAKYWRRLGNLGRSNGRQSSSRFCLTESVFERPRRS